MRNMKITQKIKYYHILYYLAIRGEKMNINPKKYKIVLAGNPNVGKSTVFNGITGMHQHTGNWARKNSIKCNWRI